MLTTTLDRELGTKVSKTGDPFTATVAQTLYASDGSVVVPAGAKIEGRVTALDDSDNATEPSLIRLAFDRIRFGGSALIGGAIGAAAGSIISLGTEVNATLPAGSHMTLRANQATTLR